MNLGLSHKCEETKRCPSHFPGMANYRFDIIDGNRVIPDEDGVDLPNDQLAYEEGVRTAQDMLYDAAAEGRTIGHQFIDIWDGDRRWPSGSCHREASTTSRIAQRRRLAVEFREVHRFPSDNKCECGWIGARDSVRLSHSVFVTWPGISSFNLWPRTVHF